MRQNEQAKISSRHVLPDLRAYDYLVFWLNLQSPKNMNEVLFDMK